MTNPKPLSPAAQKLKEAVVAAFWDQHRGLPASPEVVAAAVIRLLADQVAPMPLPTRWPTPMSGECMRIRAEMLAIATELEGSNA
jgi:hypothetical protein